MYFLIFIIIFAIVAARLYYSYSCEMCTCETKMSGKVVIVTGANTGIGYETARNLAKRGAKVILGCRDIKRGSGAADSIVKATGNTNVLFKQLDLSSLQSVRYFAQDILKTESQLDVLINNAATGPLDNSLTEDSLPIEVQVNYFAPFLLTILLLPLLKSSAPSRIINVSSIMHIAGNVDVNTFHKQTKNYYLYLRIYSDTKLANILFTNKLSEDLKGTRVTANSLNPGATSTDIFRNFNAVIQLFVNLFFRTSRQGAQTVIHLAVSPELMTTTGKYFDNCRESWTSRSARDMELANKLWDLSCKETADKQVM